MRRCAASSAKAQTSARLHHPNIITVYDYGVLSTGGAYLVMELVFGETLRSLIKREGWVDPHISAELFAQVLEGVKAAHQAGLTSDAKRVDTGDPRVLAA